MTTFCLGVVSQILQLRKRGQYEICSNYITHRARAFIYNLQLIKDFYHQ